MLSGKVKACLFLFLVLEASWGGVSDAASMGDAKATHKKVHGSKGKKGVVSRLLEGTAKVLKAGHRGKAHHKKSHALEGEGEGDAEDDVDASQIKVTEEDLAKDLEEEKARLKKKGIYFLIAVAVTIVIVTCIAFGVTQINQKTGVWEFFQMQYGLPLNIFVGLSSGIVFGMIDNMGLFFGMEYLDPYFEGLWKGTEKNMSAGYGNTFSDFIGAFLGTFAGKIVFEFARMAEPDLQEGQYPIWTEAIGITIGCIIGVVIPRFIIGDPDQVVISKAASQALQSGVTQSEIDAVMAAFDKLDSQGTGTVKLADLITNTDDKVNAIIANADLNGDGRVDKDEVLKSLRIATMKAKALREQASEDNQAAHDKAKEEDKQEQDEADPDDDEVKA